MILVEGWMRFESAKDVENFLATAIDVARATKATEPGCLEYAFSIDIADPTMLRVSERWADDAALKSHFKTPHMAAFGQAMASARVAGASIKVYSGEYVKTLMER